MSSAPDPGLERYLDRPLSPPDPAVLAALERPIDPGRALPLARIGRLTDPEPLGTETGWCTLPDGVGYIAVRTEMPEVTGEMVDWWFEWHPRHDLRYRVWFPPGHVANRYVPPDPAAAGSGDKPNWGSTHFPVEDFGTGVQKLRISFLRPSAYGFGDDMTDRPEVATIVGGLSGDPGRHTDHTVMTHVFLRAGDGVVLRSRFWIGAAIRPDLPGPLAAPLAALLNRRRFRERLIPERTTPALARHCAEEYANLAALLPELWREYGPGG